MGDGFFIISATWEAQMSSWVTFNIVTRKVLIFMSYVFFVNYKIIFVYVCMCDSVYHNGSDI